MIGLGLGLRERGRSALRRLRSDRGADPPAEAYRRFQADVEPILAAAPRVHRFAAEPIVGTRATPPMPVAVGIETSGGGDLEATRAALAGQSLVPAEAREGAPRELLAGGAGWIAIVAAGDALAPDALLRLGQAATLAPGAALITCDEDELGPGGARVRPLCRPGPSPDRMLAVYFAGGLLCVDRGRVAVGDLDLDAPPEVWRYDLALALAGADAAGHAHVPQFLVHRAACGTGRPDAGAVDERVATVVARRLAGWGQAGARVETVSPGRRRVRRAPQRKAEVEAIVAFRDRPELLARCARGLLDRSSYPASRLSLRLVDNGSVEPETAALVEDLDRDPRVRVQRDARRFNFSALCNGALRESSAEVVVFLNNDTEVITAGWVQELLEEAQRPEVGAVAPLLLYPDGRVQHAGAAIGLGGYADHPFAGLEPDAPTPFGSAAQSTRNWLAVTAACMMVGREKLDRVGGFDESFVVGGGDVDLCLRLTTAGHRSLCVPHVRMLHDESQSRGGHVDPGDLRRSEERYGAFRTVGDPFYNPNLTHAGTSCAIRGAEG